MLSQPKSPRPVSAPPLARSVVPTHALKERKNRSIGIGVACTILFHVLLVCLAPFFPAEKLTGTRSAVADAAAAAAKRGSDFNIELAKPEKPKDPFQFVETNPDAPENEPDKTSNFSDRNQQSAQQEKPPEIDPLNRPSTKGRDDVEGGAIVSGHRAPPQPGTPVVPLQDVLEEMVPQTPEQARAQQIPLAGTEKSQGDSADGVGTNVSRNQAPTTHAQEEIEGLPDAQNQNGGLVDRQEVAKKQMVPRERPRLASASTARSSPLANRIAGTANVGPTGIDARWSDFGVYMRELIDIVDAQWHRIVNEYRGHIASGTRVSITFTLNADGEVSITQVEETAGRVAVGQCQSAITSRMPYRKWTPEMISVLGDQQTMTFTFYYY